MSVERHRNSPRMLLIRAADAAKLYVPFLFFWASVQGRLSDYAGALVPLAFWLYTASRLHYVLADWWATRYLVSDDGITVSTGLLTRRTWAVDWSDVASVQVSRPWLHQALSCSRVSLGLGGQGKGVVTLEAVRDDVAADIQRRSSRHEPTPAEPTPAEPEPEPVEPDEPDDRIYAMRPIDYVMVSITYGQFALFVPGCLALYSEVSDWFGTDPADLAGLGGRPSLWQLALVVAALVPIAFAYGIVVAWLRYAAFEVRLRQGTLLVSGGLLSRETRQVHRSGTNGLKVRQNPLMRLMGYGSLSVLSRESGSSRHANVVFPAVALRRLLDSADTYFPEHAGQLAVEHPRRSWRSLVPLGAGLLALLIAAAGLAVTGAGPGAAILAGLAVTVLLLGNRLWASAEVDAEGGSFSYRRGFLWVTRYSVPLTGVHRLVQSQGPLARLFGVSTLAVDIHDARAVRLRLFWCDDALARRLVEALLGRDAAAEQVAAPRQVEVVPGR